MNPTPESLHVERVLTDLSVAYRNSQDAYVALQFAPMIPVEKQSDKYTIFGKADFLRSQAQVREDGKETAGIGFAISRDSYNAELYGVHFDITPRMRTQSGPDVDLSRTGMELCMDQLLLKMEEDWVAESFATSKWGTDITGVSGAPSAGQARHWSDETNGTPKKNVKDQATVIQKATGRRPNTLVLGQEVFDALQDHPDFVERLKYTSSASITREILARMLDLDRVIVAGAVVNTAAEGQSASMAFTHGKHALLAYVNPRPARERPSAAYTFGWTGIVDGAGAGGVAVSQLPRDSKTKVDRIEAESAWDFKITGTDLAVFFNGIVA